jgi:glycosyltransferase involved in cell wall biosynthesis
MRSLRIAVPENVMPEKVMPAPKVSVIIPVHNTEPYLRRCLDSVTGQTLRDIEIICVNDASPDNSGEILREYAAKDGRVRVIEFEKNRGVSAARNAGIDAARGEYIGFVDSDDWVDLEFYEKLYAKARETGADIAKGNMELTDLHINAVTTTDTLNEEIRKNKIRFIVNHVTAIYKKSLLDQHEIRYSPKGVYGEDRAFPLKTAVFAGKVETVDNVYYHYIRGQENNTDTNFISMEKCLSYLNEIRSIVRFINSLNINSHDYVYIAATFLQEIIRIFKISSNEARNTVLNCLFELYQQIRTEYRDGFAEEFKKESPDVYEYLNKNNAAGLLDYLLDNQTKYLIYLCEQNGRSMSKESPPVTTADKQETIPIFLSADNNYAPFVATTIASICFHTKAVVNFYVLDGGISEFNERRIKSLKKRFTGFTVEFIQIHNEIFKGFRVISPFSLSAYYRFLIPHFKQNLNKVIYLDVDVIALGDISELYNEKLEGYSLAAVPDTTGSAASREKCKSAMRLSAGHTYFNSGVLLIDLKKWRENNTTLDLFDTEKLFRNKLTWPDQDVLNKHFDRNYKVLDTKYNVMTNSGQQGENIIIRHFNTVWKPWNCNGVYGDSTIENFNDFWFFAAQTPFLLEMQQNSGIGTGQMPRHVNEHLAGQELLKKRLRNTLSKKFTERKSKADFPVSVIIPVYGVEPYLRKCLDSVIRQTYANLEIICVNDCSKDNCSMILDEYMRKDSRFTIIKHPMNKGQGAARNTGLDAAKGEYVYFLDSDDWLDADYIDSMVCAAQRSGAEVILNTNIVRSDTQTQFMPHVVPEVNDKFLPARENIQKIICNIWAHLYKKSFLERHRIRFSESDRIRDIEDVWFQYVAYAFVDRIYVIRGGVYHYLVRQGSCSNTAFNTRYKYIMKHISVLNEIFDFYQANFLFNKYDTKMFFRSLCPHFTLLQKEKICVELRGYFHKIKEQVADRSYLYDDFELAFFYGILSDFEYSRSTSYNKLYFSNLRKKIIKRDVDE